MSDTSYILLHSKGEEADCYIEMEGYGNLSSKFDASLPSGYYKTTIVYNDKRWQVIKKNEMYASGRKNGVRAVFFPQWLE